MQTPMDLTCFDRLSIFATEVVKSGGEWNEVGLGGINVSGRQCNQSR